MRDPSSININILSKPEGYQFIVFGPDGEWFRIMVFVQVEGKLPSNLITPEMIMERFQDILDQVRAEFRGEAMTMDFKHRLYERFIELL